MTPVMRCCAKSVLNEVQVTVRFGRSWHIAAPDVCGGTSAVGESRHRIPGASVGQPTEPCLAEGGVELTRQHQLGGGAEHRAAVSRRKAVWGVACAENGVRCSAHGLRKAACRRLAEAGCSANEIMAISCHATMKGLSATPRRRIRRGWPANAMKAFRNHDRPNTSTGHPLTGSR